MQHYMRRGRCISLVRYFRVYPVCHSLWDCFCATGNLLKGRRFFTEDGPLALLAPVLKLTGIHFLAIGLVSEILTRTSFELQNKRIYCVRKSLQAGAER